MAAQTQTPEKTEAVIEKYGIPEPEPFISFAALKDRIRHHYELASDYYYSLWYIILGRYFACSTQINYL
jgi:hypothetical protein